MAVVRPGGSVGVAVSHVNADGSVLMQSYPTMRAARIDYAVLRAAPTTAYAQITRDDEVLEQFVRPLTKQVVA